METTIPEPASPPSASTSFTSEEDCNDQNGGGKRDKALDLAFDVAASRVASFAASRKLADADALRLYGFYKQALEGDCVASRPAIWDRKGRAKWDAWTAASGTEKEESKRRYVELVESLFGGAEGSGELEGGGAGAGPGSAAAATTGASGGGGGTRFGPVFSVPGDGDDRLAGDGIDDDGGDDDEDGVVMCALSVAAAADDVDAIAELLSKGEDPLSRDLSKKKKKKEKKEKKEEEEAGAEEAPFEEAAAGAAAAETAADGENTTTTPLHWAADRGSLRAARALAAAGAPLDARDADGATPLHYACLCGRRAVAELLVGLGADAEAADVGGERARDKAPRGWGGWPP